MAASDKDEEKRPREIAAADRTNAPVPVALCGYAPERVDQMRVGFYGMEYAR